MSQVKILQNTLATNCSFHPTGHSWDKKHVVIIALGVYPASTDSFAYDRHWQNRATIRTKRTRDPLLKQVILMNASFYCFWLCHDTNLVRFPSVSLCLHVQCWFHKHPTRPFTPKSMLAVLITYLRCHPCLSFRKSAAPCLKVKLFKSYKLAKSKISTQIQNWRFLIFCMFNRKFSFYYFLLLW